LNYIFKSKVDNFEKIKVELLEKINLIPTNSFKDSSQNIMHTDWNIPTTVHREYASLFFETVKPHVEGVTKKLGAKFYNIDNFWFQRYSGTGHHDWHTHPRSHFSNVFFLECPENASTKFKNIEVNCEEGDVLSFPAFLPHRSAPFASNLIKTVIAFNSNFDVNPIS